MKIECIELYHVSMPLVAPFETSFGVQTERDCVLVAAHAGGLTGWGECVASSRPDYSYETSGTCWQIVGDFLAPGVLGREWSTIEELIGFTAWVRGHNMAKAGLQNAAWDLLSRQAGCSLAALLAQPGGVAPRERVAVGVSIGLQASVEDTLKRIERYLADGYRRIKLKIKPGRDLDLARAATSAFAGIPIMLDANSAYTLADAPLFRAMDDLGLLMIEQPLDHEDIYEHSKLQAQLQTRICLDESILSPAHAQWALDIDAGRTINIKQGRVGGLWEARRIHDLCHSRGVPVWCGGMLETGVGRATNLAIASLPNFVLPGDISATARYWHEDIIEEVFTLNTGDSTIDVPQRIGLGVTVDPARLARYTVRKTTLSH